MADRPIGSLTAASVVNEKDLFVLEQDGSAKKLTGEVLKVWLLKLAEGKGGIKGIAKTGSNGLNDTYRITFADGSTFDYSIANGKSITGIAKTGTSGLVDTYTISYNDGSKQTYTVTNGAKGDPGTSYYVWVKWSDVPPSYEYFTMGDIPGKYMGVYAGTAEKPPEDWKEYMWVKVEGKTAYQFAKDGGYTGTEEQFAEKLAFEHTTHLLNAESDIDRCIKTGMYYLTGDSQTIDSLVSKARIVHPVPVEYSLTGLVPKAVFVEVTRGSTEWSDPQNPVGQPHQHLRIYYGTSEVNQENPGVSYEFSFDRVHNVVGYEADGSSWEAWRSASKNVYTLEQERGKVYGPWAFEEYDQNLDNMNEPGATYSMFVDDNMRSKYPNLFSAINDMPAYRAVMRVGKRVDGGELFQEMVIYHRTVVGGVTTYATVNATRLLYGEPGERGWKVGTANLYGTGTGSGESAAPDTLIVEYGVTTAEELAEAVGVYKHIFCRNGDILLPMTKANTPYSFAGVVADQGQANRMVNYTLIDGEWVSYERYVSDEITEGSEDIPTAGAVYHFTKDMQDSLLVTVTETQTAPNRYEYSSDKTFQEIASAINSGKEVIARCMRYYGRNAGYQYYMYWRKPDPGCFTFRSVLDNSGTYEEFSICGNESCYLNKFELPILKTTAQELTDAQKEQVRKNIGAGTASEWSDLGESVTNLGDTLTWDGNTEGKVTDTSTMLVKVSNTVLTASDFTSGMTLAIFDPDTLETYESSTLTAEEVQALFTEDGAVLEMGTMYVIPYDNYVHAEQATTFPEAGVYYRNMGGVGLSLTIPGYNFTESTINPVPEKYLPDSIKGGGVSSYNELTDVPCGVSDTLTHCVTNDRFYDSTGFYVKVGEFVNPSEFIANGVTITRFPDGAGNQASATYNECESDINGFAYIVGTENVDAVYFVTAIAAELGEEINGKTFPKAGIYFYLEVESVTAEGSGIGVKTLDVKYINTTTEITEASTDDKLPTAKAVVDYVKNNGGGGGAPDWNASEGEPGHILNRTHYAEDVTFFSMTDATFNPDTQFMTEIEIDGELFVGRKYKVIWDGQEYECTAVDFFGDGSVNLGSDAIFGGTRTEPFMFMLDAQTGSKMLIDMESMMNGATEPVTHSVTLLGISYKTFDPNYVPPVDWDSGDGCIPIRNQPFKRNLICVFEWDGDTTDKVTIQTHQYDNTGVTVHMCRIASASDVVNAMCFEAETEDAVSGGYMFTPLSPMLDLGESGKNMCGSDFMYTIYSESVAVRNSMVYVKKDNKTDAFGLTQEGVYLQYALNNTGNKTQFVRKVKLYSVDATIPSYLGTRTCLHNVYATGLKLRSNGKLWEITVDDSGNLTATEVTN